MIRVNTLFQYACYGPDDIQIVTTGTDRKIGYWETHDGSMIREIEGSVSGSVNCMDISGQIFVSGGDDKLVKVIYAFFYWDLLSLTVITNHSHSLQFMKSGKILINIEFFFFKYKNVEYMLMPYK
jgi:WD40 repeat protein